MASYWLLGCAASTLAAMGGYAIGHVFAGDDVNTQSDDAMQREMSVIFATLIVVGLGILLTNSGVSWSSTDY